MGYDLGVDLGTTFVAAATARDGRVEMCTLGDREAVVPAVVYRTEDSNLIFGVEAERCMSSDPHRGARYVKRRLGDPTPASLGGVPYPATALLAGQLRDVLDTVTRAEGEPPDRVALTHPAGWGPYRRELFEEIPRLAGLRNHVVLTEPEAAAAHYGVHRFLGEGGIVAVYDLGGGSFDATVLRKRRGIIEIAGEPDGIERLGGIDFDEAITHWIDFRYGAEPAGPGLPETESSATVATLRQECVRAKEALSADMATTIAVPRLGRLLHAELSRRDFETMIRAPIESTVGALVRAVNNARFEVSELSAVLLVGGSSRIPLIGQMITEEIGRPIVTDAHPKHAVALGAAAAASMRTAGPGPRVPVVAGSPGDTIRLQALPPRGVSRPLPPGWAPEQTPPARSRRRRRLRRWLP
ncbi:Hsp70 family protein [Actinoplanes sp. NPDC051851]|uniref:Hsp70 family protein n=1 Tax=Actinoplanes sp. NPDC051851 TaxID=3154753 RepID=UPI0034437C27